MVRPLLEQPALLSGLSGNERQERHGWLNGKRRHYLVKLATTELQLCWNRAATTTMSTRFPNQTSRHTAKHE